MHSIAYTLGASCDFQWKLTLDRDEMMRAARSNKLSAFHLQIQYTILAVASINTLIQIISIRSVFRFVFFFLSQCLEPFAIL